MTLTDQLRTATAGHRGKLTALLVVLGLVILLVVCVRPGSRATRSSMATDPATAQAQVLEAVERQRAAVAEAGVRAARDDGEQVLRAIERIAQLRSAWDRDVQALLQNDDGRRIAGDADRLARFTTLLHVSLPETEAIAQQRERVHRLIAPAEDAVAGKIAAFKPDDAYQKQLDRERALARQQEQELTDAQRMLAALVAEAKQKNASPADLPLQAKVEQLERETAAARLRTIHEARTETEEHNTTQLADLEKRKLAEVGEAERKRREAELEAQRSEQETQAKLTEEKAVRDKLMALAKSPEVQARYQVFLAKGRYNLADDKTYNTTSFPASYNCLKLLGLLSDPELFAKAVTGNDATAGGSYRHFSHNDRPLWQQYPKTDAEWKVMKERFREFQQLAPIWREMNLLAP